MVTSVAFGQQLGNSSLYLENYSLINQAFTGYQEGGELSLGYRNQWSGIENAPQTGRLSFVNSINRPDLEYRRNALPSSRLRNYGPTLKNFWGYGAMLIVDDAGLFNRTQVMITGAYHLRVSRTAMISFAPTLNYSSYRAKVDEMVLVRPDDPVYTNYQANNGVNDFMGVDFGMSFYTEKFVFGVSAEQLASFELSEDLTEEDVEAEYQLMAAYKWRVSRMWELRPGVFTYIGANTPMVTDAYLRADYNDRFWVGAGYRTTNTFIAMVGLKLNDALKFGYAYDTGVEDVGNVSLGSHELYLSYIFK